MSNPLLGNRISLISKKNIRYEGILYSINEQDATVALQNVTSFGTEGRETEEGGDFVAPTDTVVHPYLLFRGCDIKDLHVHETAAAAEAAAAPKQSARASATTSSAKPDAAEAPLPPPPPPPTTQASSKATSQQTQPARTNQSNNNSNINNHRSQQQQQRRSSGGGGAWGGRGGRGGRHQNGGGRNNNNQNHQSRGPRKPNAAIGTGASLLSRKARGSVGTEGGPENPEGDFDFQSKLAEFPGNGDNSHDDDDDDNENNHSNEDLNASGTTMAYDKDNFFDAISCDALDKATGVDNRLRGAQERNLNTETFGAIALNTQRRRRGGGRGGRGRGGRYGRGGGGGRGRGRGRGRGGGRRSHNQQRGDRGSGNNSTPSWYTNPVSSS